MKEAEQTSIAELIKHHRKNQKMTQEQLCEATGISISTLKKYETGLRHPKAEQLQRIAEALGISEQVFMPVKVKDRSDILMTIMQLDKESDLTIDYKDNAEGVIIPETITFSFKDHELNKMLAEYVLSKNHSKTKEDQDRSERLILYKEKLPKTKGREKKKK